VAEISDAIRAVFRTRRGSYLSHSTRALCRIQPGSCLWPLLDALPENRIVLIGTVHLSSVSATPASPDLRDNPVKRNAAETNDRSNLPEW